MDVGVLFFQLSQGQDQPEREPWLFHDYQPSSGLTTLISHFGFDLIRSISVNHRVSMSMVTCRAWFCKTSLQPTPPFPNTHKPNPLTIFPIFSNDGDAHTISIIPTLNGDVHLAQSQCPPLFSSVLNDIFQTPMTTFDFELTLLLFYGNEGGRGYKLPSYNPHKTFSLHWHRRKLISCWPISQNDTNSAAMLMNLRAVSWVYTLLFL